MTEGEKNCGLSSLLPMSCRGRAEAFARRLHSRLRTLGSQDGDDPYASESSWLASNEVSGSVTSLQPRHNSDNDLFMDFGIFDTPGSPEEEITESELQRFITNPKDNLHLTRVEECQCPTEKCHVNKRNNSIDSDSSDGPYFDPDDSEHLLHNHVNGISSVGSDHNSEDSNNHELPNCVLSADSCLPSSSCTSTLSLESRNPSFSAEAEDTTVSLSKQDSLTETVSEDQVDSVAATRTSGWQLSYEPRKLGSNNNVYSAIDLETLKHNIENNFQDVEDSIATNDSDEESYSNRLEIEQNLTVECPEISETSLDLNDVDEDEIVTLETKEEDEVEEREKEEDEEAQQVEENEETPDADIVIQETCADKETISIEEASPNDDSNTTIIHHKKPEHDEHHLRAHSAQEFEDADESEERTPRVRRCSSLKTGKTPPGTPGRKKIVRFADVLGLDLADVRTFMDEIPKIPTSAYDDLSDADISLSLSDTSLCSNTSPIDLHHPKSTKLLMPLFQQPGGESNFLDKVRDNQVCLENAVVCSDYINGTVRVRNLDFNKSVHIRYSTDSWRTYADLQASYVSNSCDGFSDKFSFTLYVHTLIPGQKLEFAVRFHCKGCQYWDNNKGVNYVFECLPTSTSTPYVPITVPDDTWAGSGFY